MKMKTKFNNKLLFKFHTKALALMFPSNANYVGVISNSWWRSVERWTKSEGEIGCLARMKAAHSMCCRSLVRGDFQQESVWIRSRGGLPVFLGCKARLAFKDHHKAVLLLSITSFYSAMQFNDIPEDLSSIDSPYTGRDLCDLFPEVERISRRFAFPKPDYDGFRRIGWFTSSSSGPNGVSFKTWDCDAVAIVDDPSFPKEAVCFLAETFRLRIKMRKLLDSFKIRPLLSRIWWIENYYHRCKGYPPNHLVHKVWRKGFHHSRLAVLKQSGGKNRVVAIGDCFTQTALQPIHAHLMRCLRTIPQDGTYDQNAQVERLRKWSLEGRAMYSFDLKSCTDRFPIELQVMVMTVMFGERVAQAWKRVMVDRSFVYKGNSKYYRYSVGQGMGFLSSWAAMAVTHHVVVHLCASKVAGETLATDYSSIAAIPYAILGDDVVIADKSLALLYKEFMTQTLGVKISMNKTVAGLGCFEFAKRLCYKGLDYSPIPAKLVVRIRQKPVLAITLVQLLEKRYNMIVDRLSICRLLPLDRRLFSLKLLTCPLWFDNNKFEDLWGARKESLYVLGYAARLRLLGKVTNMHRIAILHRNMDKVLNDRIQHPFYHVGYVTPFHEKLGSMIHKLTLGTAELGRPQGGGGEGFTFNNLVSGADLNEVVRLEDLTIEDWDQPKREAPEIQSLVDGARSVAQIMKDNPGIGHFNFYVFWCYYFT